MERIHYRISLDMFDTVSQKTLKAKKGDTACDIIITLTENGKVYQIAEGCSATFTAKKADGNFLYNEETCSIEGNNITYGFTEQTTACEGIVDCEVILYGADGHRLTSPRFSLLVGGTVYNGEEIISTPETDMMKELIKEAEEAIDEVDKTLNKMGELATKEDIKNLPKLSPDNPNGISGAMLVAGHPIGDGTLWDTGVHFQDLVNHRSFTDSPYELIMVNSFDDVDTGEPTSALVGSGIRFDEVALKENWELINEVTLTEDAVVSFTTDSEGNPFKLKKFKIMVELGSLNSNSSVWIGINQKCLGQSANIAATGAAPCCYVEAFRDVVAGWRILTTSAASNSSAPMAIYTPPKGHRYSGSVNENAESITIALAANLTTVLHAGATAKLWGVRV